MLLKSKGVPVRPKSPIRLGRRYSKSISTEILLTVYDREDVRWRIVRFHLLHERFCSLLLIHLVKQVV
ncbi:hypothetical protein L1987_00406 [Smallanthus sonchifolius]|uniref:Uncharacterized protein n=1 Tax=Smallanthus sonchifolius TaxID=185202 RepID=A0ACB9K267_9ASTR|nr:hypothetical protein L1987_00406 [Smallanthus sonchifolius]